jgi:hypothetical protein
MTAQWKSVLDMKLRDQVARELVNAGGEAEERKKEEAEHEYE